MVMQRKPPSVTIKGGGRVLSGLGKRMLAARLLKCPDGENGHQIIGGELVQQGIGKRRVAIDRLTVSRAITLWRYV